MPYDAVDLPVITTDTCASLTVWTITCVGVPRFGDGFDMEAVHEIALGPVLLGEGAGAAGVFEGFGRAESGASPGVAVAELGDVTANIPETDVDRLAQPASRPSVISVAPIPAARANRP